MVSTVYRKTVRALSRLDAIEDTERQARQEGWRVVAIESCKQDALGRWAVVLLVIPSPG